MDEGGCRLDVWLWRARFFKARSQAAEAINRGRLRLTRAGIQRRVDKPSRLVRHGDTLVFIVGERLIAARIEALGKRRGPPAEARALWTNLDIPPETPDEPPFATHV